MNPTQSHTQPFPHSDDEPLKLHEVAMATALVVTVCAGVAVTFTAIATCQYVGDTVTRIRTRRKGGRRAL